jgi:bacillithiol system protein YtxJ
MKKMIKLNSRNQLDILLMEPGNAAEIIIFKSSPYCGTSAVCEKVFDEWFNNLSENYDIICVKVDVIEALSLSSYIADEFGIKHESPQALYRIHQQYS